MKLALIGPGAMGEEHALAFARLGGVEPYLVAGPHRDSLEAFASQHGFTRTSLDPFAAIADPTVDIVVIASPNAAHYQQAKAAIELGKHVLIEIPMALELAEAEELAALAAASESVVMAAHISRYYPAVQRLKRSVAAEELTLRHLICSMGTDKRQNRNWKGAERDWVDDLLWHHGMHVLDVVLELNAGAELSGFSVQAGGRHQVHGGVMDLGVGLRFASGALATVALTYNAGAQFTRYTVVADELFSELAQDAPGAGRADLTENRPFADLVDAQDSDFLAACRAGTAAPIPLTSVLPVMRLVDDLATDLGGQLPTAART